MVSLKLRIWVRTKCWSDFYIKSTARPIATSKKRTAVSPLDIHRGHRRWALLNNPGTCSIITSNEEEIEIGTCILLLGAGALIFLGDHFPFAAAARVYGPASLLSDHAIPCAPAAEFVLHGDVLAFYAHLSSSHHGILEELDVLFVEAHSDEVLWWFRAALFDVSQLEDDAITGWRN